MLRLSLNLFLENLIDSQKMDEALEKLKSKDFYIQLRNELTMIPIPKFLSNEYNKNAPFSQGHYSHFTALERVSSFKWPTSTVT